VGTHDLDLRLLCQSWLRSRSEDTETEEIYRPAGYAFPRPERGRAGYQFSADGTAKRIGIGATDVSEVTPGRWQADGERPGWIRLVVDGREQVLEIADLTPDRLAIRRSSAAGGG
jgi:hypothetical protein